MQKGLRGNDVELSTLDYDAYAKVVLHGWRTMNVAVCEEIAGKPACRL
jgi:hypothetical protein